MHPSLGLDCLSAGNLENVLSGSKALCLPFIIVIAEMVQLTSIVVPSKRAFGELALVFELLEADLEKVCLQRFLLAHRLHTSTEA